MRRSAERGRGDGGRVESGGRNGDRAGAGGGRGDDLQGG
ncbi:MAG: 30S ribosomal protein S5, partial [Planctomycetota bacterium]